MYGVLGMIIWGPRDDHMLLFLVYVCICCGYSVCSIIYCSSNIAISYDVYFPTALVTMV